MKTISVCVITYNQEDVIGRALESILRQKDWGLYRIIVSDDCSKDRTWEILLEYQEKYPLIVCPYRNDHNLGIYQNLAKAESLLPVSDLYINLSGDDELCDGYFERVQRLIEGKKIDTNEAIGIYSDWASVNPKGKKTVFKQDSVLSDNNLWSLKARGKIGGRSLMISQRVRDGYEPILIGRGLNLTESHYESQAPLNIKKAYYLPFVSSLYYTGIGISSRLLVSKSDYLTTQCIEKWNYGLKHYVKNERDYNYGQYEILKAEFYLHPKWRTIYSILKFYIKGQLPGCRDSFVTSLRIFASLIKYKLVS